MKVSTVLTIPVNLLVIVLSIVSSSLGVAVLARRKFITALLLFVIGGYMSAILSAIPTISRKVHTPLYFIFLLLAYIFQIVTGIIFCINIIQHNIDFSQGQKHWEVAMTVIFIINVFLMAISITVFSIICLLEPEETKNDDLEKITVSLTHSLCNTQISRDYLTQESKIHQNLSINQDPRISKKTSDQTLVEIPLYDTVVRNKMISVGEENDLAYMMQYSPNGQMESSDHLYYTDNNWMDSNEVVKSMKYSTDLNESSNPSTPVKSISKKSFSLFGFNSKQNETTNNTYLEKPKMMRDLKQSHSVPNLIKSDTFEGNAGMNHNYSKQTKINPLYGHDEFCKSNIDVKKIRKVSLIEPIPEQIDPVYGQKERVVKRSKSTGYINGNIPKKIDWAQRRKSIHDEKSFLQNVNESLLPAVLKTGESPIAGLKRQQQEILDKNAEELIKSPITQRRTNKSKSGLKESAIELSPVGETGLSDSNIDQIEDNTVHSDHINLPFISEFDEPIDQEKFLGFDQDTAYVEEVYPTAFTQTPKKKGSYIFKDVNYDIPLAQSGQHTQADTEISPGDYAESLNGLEKIPKTTSYSSILWNQDTNRKGTPTSMKHISLKDWDNNSERWNEQRARSGANLNIAGITRLVSDHNLRSMNTGNNNIARQEMKEEYLLPPLDTRLDNIDNLSDLHSATGSTNDRKSNSLLSINRSSSAPSLHTYRDLYPTETDSRDLTEHSYSNEEKNNSVEYVPNPLKRIVTPPECQTDSTVSSSPIKKFFQESPKRLNIMFKRKPVNQRYSVDLNSLKDPQTAPFHKHSGSTISNQISLYSYKSSKSNSPRKSLRTLLRSPSKQQSPSTSAPSFAEMSKPKQANMFNNNDDDSCLLYVAQNALSFWDLETAHSSDRSRVSSVPSAVIGEYDREKWRTLKALQNQEKVTFDTVESIR